MRPQEIIALYGCQGPIYPNYPDRGFKSHQGTLGTKGVSMKTPTKKQLKLIVEYAFRNCKSDIATTDFLKCCIIAWEKIRDKRS